MSASKTPPGSTIPPGTLASKLTGPSRSANAITDFLWCLACEVPHEFDGEEINLVGEDVESMACLEPYGLHSEVLPKDWEREWIAFDDFDDGYTLYPKSIEPTGDHCPMYYLDPARS